MLHTVFVKNYEPPAYDLREVLRYAGVRGPSAGIEALAEDCIRELGDRVSCKVCYAEFPIRGGADGLDLIFARTGSRDLARNLAGCGSVVLFAATIGLELDRLIARYARVAPSRAHMFQAVGAERIESLCDLFNREISSEKALLGKITRPRFSPGYGDLPLELQSDIFRVLDCPRRIGLSLNESLLMSPSKSVTALIGVGEKAQSLF